MSLRLHFTDQEFDLCRSIANGGGAVYKPNRTGKCTRCSETFRGGIYARNQLNDIRLCLRCADIVFQEYSEYAEFRAITKFASSEGTFMERDDYQIEPEKTFSKSVRPSLSEIRDTARTGRLFRRPYMFYADVPGITWRTRIPCDKCNRKDIRTGLGKGDCMICLCCAAAFL